MVEVMRMVGLLPILDRIRLKYLALMHSCM